MSPATRRGLQILGAGALLGVAGRTLFLTVPERLSLALWVACGLVTLAALGEVWRTRYPLRAGVLGAGLGLGTAALLWRDGEALLLLNLATLFGLLTLGSHWASGHRPWRDGLVGQGRSALRLAGHAMAGATLLAGSDVRWREVRVPGRLRPLRAAGVGLVAAVPVLAVLGGLLVEADPVFAGLLRDLPLPDLGRVPEHLLVAGVLGWVAAGLLRGVLRPAARAAPPGGVPSLRGRIGAVEIGVVLGAVVLLFGAFVGVQARYLFGGEAALASTGLSYSAYARRGFFELVWVGALTLPLVLVTDWLVDRRAPRAVRSIRWVTAALLALLQVILVSALFRMRLYTEAYGLTELRLYATAFMGWLFLAFGWVAVTLLRGRRHRFATGAAAAAVLVVGALNLANPAGLIAEVNVGRGLQDAPFDAAYLASLGADAVPVLVRRGSALDPDRRCALALALEARPRAVETTRVWNLARVRAARLAPRSAALAEGCARPTVPPDSAERPPG